MKDNRSKFKTFQPNNMLLGPIQVAVGTIPKGYKWFTSLMGFKGSVKDGMQLMRKLVNEQRSLCQAVCK